MEAATRFTKTAREAFDKDVGAKESVAEGKASLMEFDDGVRFVDVVTDQSQFDGLSRREMGALATKIIKAKFAGKVVGLDNRTFVNGRYAGEYGFPRKRLGDAEHEAKMRASTELDNLIDAGRNFRTEPDGRDGHNHPDLVDDFRYFDTIFRVDGEYYSGVINIMPVNKGLLLKDITEIRNITEDISSSYGETPKSTFLRDASMDNVAQDDTKSQEKSSLAQKVENEEPLTIEVEEILEAYLRGELTGSVQKAKAQRLDTTKKTGYSDSRF